MSKEKAIVEEWKEGILRKKEWLDTQPLYLNKPKRNSSLMIYVVLIIMILAFVSLGIVMMMTSNHYPFYHVS